MTTCHRAALLLPATFVALVAAFPAMADTTVKVSLWDKGPDSMVMDDAHVAMMGKMSMMPDALMGVKLDKVSVPAGKVTFEVSNDSKDIIHEFMISPVTPGQTELPYVADETRVDEEKAGHLGEVAELDPGKAGSVTIELKPGTYIAYCNIPGHFIDGMWTMLTVTP